MAQKIEIPVSLSAQIENLREIRQTLTATLNSAGKDSSLAKTLTKDLSKINQMLGQVEEFALSPTIDESGLKQLQKVLDNFYKQAQSSFSNADFANFEAIASESDIARLKALTTEAAKYRRELEALQKSGSSERTDAYLLRTGKQGLLGKAQAQKGFDSTASLGKNVLAMERAAESYQRSADAMQTAIDKLESEANAAITNAQQAAQQVKALEQQKQTLGADTQAARFHHAAGRFKTAIVANRGVENPTINSVERGLRSALESVQANGKIATDARNAVGDWIKHLFPQLPTSDIASMVGQDINTLLSDLMERIFGSGYLDTDVIYSPEHSAILSRAQDYSRSEINRIAGIHSTANVLDLTARSQQVDSDWRKAKSRWTAYNNEADSKVTSWLEMTDQQEELTAAAQATAQLSQELYTLADAAQKAAIASKEAQIQQNAEAQQDLKEGTIRSTRQLAQQGKAASRQYQIAGESFVGELNENLKGVKIDANEAEQFTNNLKQSITHWMSAQQIVNLVKDGIRQAYQDIKSLDAAMTNIAVVTDMSVSDLWGKINEYMSIAQQYGVTTQGVYEVSQLYYQQGLSTNEVMAATTETLKMARIAGMGYAEAADAMTVAIRSFKMEMSDAGHVTDVYSKVAAVTASDTEELAIAMSKTASSAESVGSSFENTTAMLAVMIETTRESAQNLGSALKSIISRYGEMKSGMTQDSEGEIIDYNKTDAALRSVGISLKDAQGQFRDFDDVIFELSAKWDSLDKNTQRYIATIMAGNRQQSRFIALVDNWERLEEVTGAAQDSEDAGLLQYAKTLDSLESKLNTLKTSFQQFYMSIFDGEFFKGFVDIITNVIDNLSKMGPLLGGINLLQLINQIKLVGQLLLNTFSKNIGKIQQSSKEWQRSFTNGWPSVGERIADAIAKAIVAKAAPTGKQFAEGVVQGAQGGQGQLQNVAPQKNQGQVIEIKNKYREQAQGYLKQIGLDFSVGNLFGQNGKLTKNASKEFLSPKKNSKVSSFENLTQSYQKQADIILKASDSFDNAAVNWANKVKAAGNNFDAKIGAAGKKAYLTALQAADAEAEIELAAAKQAAAEQKKAITQQKWGQGLVMAGTALSSAGMMMDQSTMAGYDKSTWLQTGGAAASVLGQALTGNYIGAAITAISGAVTTITRWQERDKVELENAKKDAEEKNIERAQKKDKWQSLETYAKKLKEAEKARYDSNEAEQEWLNLNNEIAEKYPELISYIDAEGNSIVNLTEDYEGLSRAKREYLEQEAEYWDKKVEEARLERDILSDTHIGDFRTSGGGLEGVDNATLSVVGWARNNHQLQSTISSQLAFYDKNQGNITDADYLDSFFSEEGFYGKNLEDLITILGLTDDEVNKVFGRGGFRFGNWTVAQARKEGFNKVTSQDDLKKFYTAAVEEGLITGERQTALLRNSGVATYHSDYLQAASDLALGRNFTSLGEINQWLAQFSGKDGLDNLLTAGVDLSYLFTLANNKDNVLGSSLAQQILTSTGLGTQNEDGYWIVDEDSQEKWDELVKYQQNEELYNSYLRSSISSHGNLLLHDTETADMLSGMSGYEQILLQRAETYAVNGKTLLDVRDSAETMQAIYGEYATEVGEWFMNLPPAVREEFNQFMANQKDYTLEELETFLKTKLNLEEGDPLYQDLVSNWWTATNTAKYRAAKVIWKPTDADITDAGKLTEEKFKELRKKNAPALGKYSGSDEEAYKKYLEDTEADDLRMLSFDNWKTNADLLAQAKKEIQNGDSSRYVTDEEAYNYYVDSVLAKWKEYGLITEEEVALLKERSAAELEQLSTFMSIREDMHSKAAFHRKGKISEQTEELRDTWNKLLNGETADIFGIDTSQLSAEAKGELASLLVAENVGTIEWLKSVGEYAAKYGLNVEEVKKAAAEYVQSSFSTEVALLVDATDEFKTTLEDFAKKQQSGYTFEEAKQLMNQLKATGKKYDFTDVFEVNEQGLLVLKNFDQTYEDLYNSTLDRYTQFSDALGFLPKIPEGVQGEQLEDLLKTTLGTLVAYSTDVAGYLKTLSTEDVNPEAYQKAQTGLTQAYDNIKEFLKTNLKIEDEVLIDSIIKDLEAHQYTTATEIYNYLQSKAEELKISSDMLEAAFIQSLSQHSFIEATKKYTNALTAKDATSASTVGDLDSILKERAKITTLTVDGKKQDYSTWSLTQEGWDQYYAAELAALETHGASLDAFGNLVVKGWNAWGEYIASSYGYSQAKIDAIQDKTKKAAAQKAREQILAEAKASQLKAEEDYANSIQNGFTSIAESFAKDGKIEFSELEGILTALQSQGLIDGSQYNDIIDAYIEAKDKGPEAIKEVLQTIANYTYGTDVDLTGINEAYKDAVLSIIKSVFDNISSALEGTINATDLSSLAEQLGLPDLTNFGLQTIDGFQLNAEGLLLVLDGVQKKYGNIYGTAEKMVEMLVGDGKMYGGYQDIEAAAEELLDTNGEIIAGYEEEYELLKQMAAVARGMADDARFDFMNQDQTGGMGDTWDTMVNNAKTARSALKTLNEEGSIDIREFQNMMAFIKSENQDDPFGAIGIGAENARASLKKWAESANPEVLTNLGYNSAESFKAAVDSIGSSTELYDFYINTIIAANGKLDGIDASAMANFGLQIGNVSKGMSESIKKVAQDQITYLKGIRGMLEAMKALEDIGDISLGSFEIDGETVDVTFDNYKFYLPKMDEKQKQQLSASFKDQFLGKKEGQFGIDENLFTLLFGEDGLDITSEADQAIISQFTALSNMTKEQWEQFVLTYPELVKDGKIDWNAVARLVLDGFDPNNFIPYIDAKTVSNARANLQKAIEAAINDDNDDLELHLQYDSVTGEFIVPENGDANTAIAAVEKYYSEAGASVEATVENGVIKIHYINPKVKAVIDNLDKKENTVEFDADNGYTITTKLSDDQYFTYRIDPKNGTITDKDGNPFKPEDVPEALREKWLVEGYEEVPTEIEGGETTVSYKINTEAEGESNPLADIKETLDLIYGMFSSGQVLSLSFDNTSAEATQTVLDAILAAWDTLIKLDGSTVTLNVNQGGNAGPQIPAGAEDANQAKGGVAVPLTIDKANFISQLTTLYTSITNNTDGIEPPVIKVIAEWQEGSPINLEAEIKAQTFIQDVQLNYTNKDGYKQTGLVQNVRLNYIHGPIGLIAAKGNVALANGNISNLLAGAALAQGTLMGELGPELYVQGGQYHIAGANGPEFVDLDRDAIVFNHLQTASLLGKGHATTTGSPVTSERRAVGAYATGNVSGPAMAGGIDSAIAAIDSAIAMWQNILNATAADLLGGGGGGGGGGENSVKAVTEELVKWYNLSRQIEKLEQDINNILAERENITDGGEYLRSLREQQQLLAQQAATQRTLLAYQEEQLERQQEHIKNNKIWSQFLTFDESGNLQYIVGNESNGGQGQLSVLEQLNKMSGEEQLNYIKNTLGYSYTDQDGNKLDGEELIAKFFEELQGQIDSYDALFDTVNSTEEKLQEIQSTMNEIDQEIEQNQMDLEQAIYDIIVDAWEKQIEQMEEQMELVQEANEAYIENLNKALSDERDMYSQNESIADRESLQNRLALLRRSGGSASEIYDLEQQLDSMLKDEYFNKQEKMIENIEEASKEQIKKLEEQIKLEEEALEYQKENGVLWTQVYEIMRGTEESILAFMQGNSPEFFSQSTLQQKQMLTDWAKQIGIYTEDQQYKNYQKEAEDTRWNNGSWRASASEGGVGQELAAVFDGLDADQQGTLQSMFTSTYANKMLETGDENAASAAAIAALQAQLRNIQSQQASAAAAASSGGGGNDSGGTGQNPSSDQKPNRYRVDYNGHLTHASTGEIKKVSGYGLGDSAYEAQRAAEAWAKKKVTGPWYWQVAPTYSKPKAFAKGGLVDYTGPALVHGSPSKPEAFLNAKQTAMISEAVKAVGDGGALNGIKATLAALNSTIKGIVNNDNSLTSSFTVAPGAVTIQVAQLNDSYDVEELSKDVMNRMVAIASRATNRGVNRR